MTSESRKEGSLDAPQRHPLDWQSESFYDSEELNKELERVFDVCHGCRRCFNLCNAFPTLFDAVDESDSGELDTVPKKVYWEIVDQCYLCDMCFMSKCPYVPPHEWNIDFPKLMLRAKAKKYKDQGAPLKDKILASTDMVSSIAGIPVITEAVNALNASKIGRSLLDKTLGVDPRAHVEKYYRNDARNRLNSKINQTNRDAVATKETNGRAVLYTTCYGNRNDPEIVTDLASIFEHNNIPIALAQDEKCCGMPKLELGDLEGVDLARQANIPALLNWVEAGWDIVAPIPSCVLMFKQELPLLFPDDPAVAAVAKAFFDPFEYLDLRHKDGFLNIDFNHSLGKVIYQIPCHLRVQNLGMKTRDILKLIPDTEINVIERCSGHDGTYGVKSKFRDAAEKIAKPIINQIDRNQPDYLISDCPMAGKHLDDLSSGPGIYKHPLTLLRFAYGI